MTENLTIMIAYRLAEIEETVQNAHIALERAVGQIQLSFSTQTPMLPHPDAGALIDLALGDVRLLTSAVRGAMMVVERESHAETCVSFLGPDKDYPCSCWKADLQRVMAAALPPAVPVTPSVAQVMLEVEMRPDGLGPERRKVPRD